MKIRTTKRFSKWFRKLRDNDARALIAKMISEWSEHDVVFGDIKHVGLQVYEWRIHRGPGYRVYFMRRGSEIILLLAGGSKGTQKRDIAQALKDAKEVEDYDE